jgi:hypothetical protein
MKRTTLAALSIGAFALAACSDSSTGSGSGKLTVKMTDAPFPFAEVGSVNVFVTRIDARIETTTDADAEDPSEMDGWRTIAEPNQAFNLLSLQGGTTANLGTSSLPSGTYRSFRLILDPSQSNVTLANGTDVSVIWPSAGHSGIKIKLDEPVEITGDSSVMTLDFDVGRSFVMRGNSISQNGLLFKPVIRAVATDITGSISGTVRADTPTGDPMAGVTVEVLAAGTLITDTDEDNIVASTVTNANGTFTIGFLMPGTYVVRATPATSTTYQPALLAGGLTITNGLDVTGKTIVVTK